MLVFEKNECFFGMNDCGWTQLRLGMKFLCRICHSIHIMSYSSFFGRRCIWHYHSWYWHRTRKRILLSFCLSWPMRSMEIPQKSRFQFCTTRCPVSRHKDSNDELDNFIFSSQQWTRLSDSEPELEIASSDIQGCSRIFSREILWSWLKVRHWLMRSEQHGETSFL